MVPSTVRWSYPLQTPGAPLKASKLFFGSALKMSADFMLCGSVADLDTACCNTPSSKQLTNVAAGVSAMAVERGGRLDGAELWMHSSCLGSGSGGRMWCVCVLRLLKFLLA